MKIYLLSLFVLLSSCTAMKSKSDLPKLGESEWNLTSILKRPVNYGDRAFLRFDEKENKISGRAACNSFFAEYEMIGQKISFARVGSTKMYCEGIMDDENRIISELQKVTRYEVKANVLYLYAGDTLALTYKR